MNHKDYTPVKVIDRFISSVLCGAIIKLRFKKTKHLTFLEFIWFKSRYKDIYFWLPYKKVLDVSPKYSSLGSSKRFPYANVWFEIMRSCSIYEQGLNNYTLSVRKSHNTSREIRLALPFLGSELLMLRHKKVIRVLDSYLFNNKRQPNKRNS